MAGLVSRWANDDPPAPESKPTKAPKSKLLESKWATDSVDTQSTTSPDISSKYQKLAQELETQEPRKPKTKPKRSRNRGRDHKERPHNEPAPNDDNDDEILPPMTDAARSLASRLGVGIASPPPSAGKTSRPPSAPKKHEHSPPKSTKPAVVTPPHEADDGFVTTDEDVSDNEELPPMGDAGKSLASRLGMLNVQEKNTTPKPKLKYQTPKQKREEALKKKREEDKKRKQEAEALKQKKQREAAEKEIERIVAEMSDPNLSWADV